METTSSGCCPVHPAIQLRRWQRRTGEWRTLLTSCPLCVAQGNSQGSDSPDDEGTVSSRQSRSSRSRGGTSSSASVDGIAREGRTRRPLPSQSLQKHAERSHSQSRNGSRSSSEQHQLVRFHPETKAPNLEGSLLCDDEDLVGTYRQEKEQQQQEKGEGDPSNRLYGNDLLASSTSLSLLRDSLHSNYDPLEEDDNSCYDAILEGDANSIDRMRDDDDEDENYKNLRSSNASSTSSSAIVHYNDRNRRNNNNRSIANDSINSSSGGKSRKPPSALKPSSFGLVASKSRISTPQEKQKEREREREKEEKARISYEKASLVDKSSEFHQHSNRLGDSPHDVSLNSLEGNSDNQSYHGDVQKGGGHHESKIHQQHEQHPSQNIHRLPPPPRRDGQGGGSNSYRYDSSGGEEDAATTISAWNNQTPIKAVSTRSNASSRTTRSRSRSRGRETDRPNNQSSSTRSKSIDIEERRTPSESAAVAVALSIASSATSSRSASTTRGKVEGRQPQARDSSRSKQREEEDTPNTLRPPPVRSRSQSRSRQTTSSREGSVPPVSKGSQPPPPASILRNGSNVGSNHLRGNPGSSAENETESVNGRRREERVLSHNQHKEEKLHSQNYSGSIGPSNRLREPPGTPQEEMDDYSQSSHRRTPQRPAIMEHGRKNSDSQLYGVSNDLSDRDRYPNHHSPQPPHSMNYHHQQHSNQYIQEKSFAPDHQRMPSGGMTPPIKRAPRSAPLQAALFPRDYSSSPLNSSDPGFDLTLPPNNISDHHRGYTGPIDNNRSSKKNDNSATTLTTESETNPESSVAPSMDNDDSESIHAEASEYDSKGRCVKHPHIKLRKKKLLGGWKVMLVNCPDCCIESMLNMRGTGAGGALRNSGSKGGSRNASRQKRSASQESEDSRGVPPISQLTISKKEDEDGRSISSNASEITYGTKTDYLRGSNVPQQLWQQYAIPNHHPHSPPSNHHPSAEGRPRDNSALLISGPHCVTRMPFTDAYGRKGWYSGEVATASGLPHGRGTIHYCDGGVKDGYWSHGLAAGKAEDGGFRGSRPGRERPSSGNSVNSRNSQYD